MKLILALPLVTVLTNAEVAVGRVAVKLDTHQLPYPITSGKRLRQEIEKIVSDQDDMSPLIFQVVNLPHIDNLSIDDVSSAYGSLLSVRESETRSMSGFVSFTIFDSLNKLMGVDEDSDFDEGSVVDTKIPTVCVITDVPNLINAATEIERYTSNPSPLQQRLNEIQHSLLANIANLNAVTPPKIWEDMTIEEDTSVCAKLVMAEGQALQSLVTAFSQGVLSENSGLGKPVIVIALTQGISCYADEHDKAGILKSIELLGVSMPSGSIRAIVPTESWAPLDVAVAVAKASTGQPWRRKLQGLVEVQDLPPDMQPLRSTQLDGPSDGSQQPPQPKAPRAGPEAGTYIYAERRLIFTGVAIVLTVGALSAVITTAYMPLNKDPLLYTKINTGAH
eukprot:Gregarina_sp_Pseudo_9__4277@NODE_442_length_2821_cov_67_168943_g418_i0_p1_GENE_NODE_442_length_2821_cov_67_168943_g418_i0NODE_442_length_2821_cov_67_168943_g418_i0_p1_ORF_typecomplete_len406_score41_33_NODE_442_length_2821_cov_67_168943_g418_i0441219